MERKSAGSMAFDEEWAERWLESKGWKRSVAGDDDFQRAVKAVVAYVADPSRGIVIIGNVGVGKTALASILFGYLRTDKVRIDCSDSGSVDMLVPESDASVNGGVYNSEVDEYFKMAVMIDDIGTEQIRSSYTNVLDRVGNFIVRYEARGTGRLILTTNKSLEELMKRYGDRVVDRILNKCIVLKLSGESKRNRMVFA